MTMLERCAKWENEMNDVCRKLGFEHRLTIQFCGMVEKGICSDEQIFVAYQQIMNM